MRAVLVALFALLAAVGRTPAVDALTGTWSPDRQIAIAGEQTGGKWRCYFRDQHTGANLGDVPLHDPRPAGGEVLMCAARNFDGTRVALLIHYDWDAEERFFQQGRRRPFATGPVKDAGPDPVPPAAERPDSTENAR